MNLSMTSWSLPMCTLLECKGIAQTLGIHAIDLGYFYRSSLNKMRLLQDPEEYGKEIKTATGTVANLYHLFGESLGARNLAGSDGFDENLRDFDSVLRFCKSADIPSVFILPGIVNPGQSRKEAFEVSARNLNHLQQLATEAGVTLTIEPHVHSYLESPSLTMELLQAVPGLRLTLDYAHFHCLGFTQEEIDVLAPYASHVHLRQATSGALQRKLEQGTLNFAAILGTLREAGYTGYLSLEYVHQDYMNTVFDDVLSETIKLRDLVNTWIEKS
jgi:sugar phosphate isomerase/epimerase